jgi:cellulose synthase/poly-beta-1,6-N-acetylglucosamine synthase-like glycosyltransferase
VGIRRAAQSHGSTRTGTLSVAIIVAARNEAASIGRCIRAIRSQTHGEFSLFVVDDRSGDDTLGAASNAAGNDPRIKVLRSAEDDSPSMEGIPFGKKRALMTGIQAGTADLLVFTDADCQPGPQWLSALVDAFDDDTSLVAGYSPYHPRSFLLPGLVAAEAAGTAVMAGALFGLGRPVMCSARNLAYRRAAYDAVGGLGPVADIPSGDDTLMLGRIAALGTGGVRYLVDPDSHVQSRPPAGWTTWFRQKRRHLSTIPRLSISTIAGIVVIRSMDALVVIGVPLALFGVTGPAPLWAWLFKALADFAGLWIGLGYLGERRLLVFLPLLELVHSPLLLVTSLLGATKRGALRWN